ncbi:hypothetical protein Esti_002348 [Eimeria stiedai]
MQLRWTLQVEGPAASLPLPALLKAVAIVGGNIHDCRLSHFASLAVLNVLLSVRQGTKEELRQKLLSVTSQTNWHFSLCPAVIDGGSSELGTSSSSRGTGSSCSGTLDEPESFCLRVLLPDHLLPSSLLAATCQVLERRRCCVLSSVTEKAFPLLSSAKKRRLLLKVSFRLPTDAPSNWLVGANSACGTCENRSQLNGLLLDLSTLLFKSKNLPWALSRSCFVGLSLSTGLAATACAFHGRMDCIFGDISSMTRAFRLGNLNSTRAQSCSCALNKEVTPQLQQDQQHHRQRHRHSQTHKYQLSLNIQGQDDVQQNAISEQVAEEASNRQFLAIISTDLPTGSCDVYATTPAPGEEDALLPLLGLRSWEVRLFARSCTFLAATRRAKTSSSRNHNDSSSSSDCSSESGSDNDLEWTDGGLCLQAREKVYSLSHAAPWWSNSVLDAMKHERGLGNSLSGEALDFDLSGSRSAQIFFTSMRAERLSNRALAAFRLATSEPATGHQQLQDEEARGLACLVDTAAEPVKVDVAPLRAQQSREQTSSKSSSNCSSHNECNSRTHQDSSSRISIPTKGDTEDTRSSGGKTYELLLVQQPHLTSRFVSDAAAAAEATGASLCHIPAECHRVSSAGEFVGVRFFVLLPKGTSSRALRARLQQVALGNGADFMFRRRSIAGLCLQLVCFDMDSTLIEEEVIDEIAAEVGEGQEVAALTRCAMGGSLPFAESLRRRLSVLKGLDRAALSKVARRLTLTQGGLALCRLLKARGVFLAILSGGFAFFADELKQKLQVDFTAANQLSFTRQGQLTGEAHDPIVTPEEKGRLLLLLSEQQQQRWQPHLAAAAKAAGPAAATAAAAVAATAAGGLNAAAIGDGSNDILMLRAAKTGIAFCAKENVRAKVPIHLNARNLWLAAYFLGIDYPVSVLLHRCTFAEFLHKVQESPTIVRGFSYFGTCRVYEIRKNFDSNR